MKQQGLGGVGSISDKRKQTQLASFGHGVSFHIFVSLKWRNENAGKYGLLSLIGATFQEPQLSATITPQLQSTVLTFHSVYQNSLG